MSTEIQLQPMSDSIEELLLFRLNMFSAQSGALLVRLCEGKFGITRREWRVLGLLHGNDGMAPSMLADRVQLDRARTSRAIGALVKKRLIARETNMTDRRGAYLSLTPAGVKLYNELMPHVQSMNKSIMSVLSEQERQQLDGWLEKLGNSVQHLNRELTSSLLAGYRPSQGLSEDASDMLDHLD